MNEEIMNNEEAMEQPQRLAPSPEKLKALQVAMDKIDKTYGRGSIKIALAVLHQTHQAIGTWHGIGTIVKIVGIGQMMTMRIGERNSLKHTLRNVGASLVS